MVLDGQLVAVSLDIVRLEVLRSGLFLTVAEVSLILKNVRSPVPCRAQKVATALATSKIAA